MQLNNQNLILKIANIESLRGPVIENNFPPNMFKCRILPDMEDLPIDSLPWFPCFFDNQDNIAYSVGDKVWLLVDPVEYSVGFILGLANSIHGNTLLQPFLIISDLEKKHNVQEVSTYDTTTFFYHDDKSVFFKNTVTNTTGFIFRNNTYILILSDGSYIIHSPKAEIKIEQISIRGEEITESFKSKTINTNDLVEHTNEKTSYINGNSISSIGGSVQENIGSNYSRNIAGSMDSLITNKKSETIGLGEEKKIVTGGLSITVLTGFINITNSGGNVSINATGPITLNSSSIVSVTASSVKVTSPIVQFPSGTVTPTGSGPFCSIPNCLFTGAPHQGNVLMGG